MDAARREEERLKQEEAKAKQEELIKAMEAKAAAMGGGKQSKMFK